MRFALIDGTRLSRARGSLCLSVAVNGEYHIRKILAAGVCCMLIVCRACLGREKVLAEAAYVVGRFAQRFERVESRDDRPWKEIMRLTAKNVHGCLVGCVEG
jgi:hypothetical protein